MARALADGLRYGIDPLRLWNTKHIRDDGTLPPPVNPEAYQWFLIACIQHLRKEDMEQAAALAGAASPFRE